jgi:hypothetical protein
VKTCATSSIHRSGLLNPSWLQVHLCRSATRMLQVHHRQAAAAGLDADMLWDAELAVQCIDILLHICCCSTAHD